MSVTDTNDAIKCFATNELDETDESVSNSV